jgi:phage gp36-like protein
MAYAALSDFFTYGMPSQAQGQITNAQILAALQDASDELDGYFRGRFGDGPSPLLLAWDTQVTKAVCKIAAYNVISVRGYDPTSSSDVSFKTNRDEAIFWCEKVQRQQAHPIVTVAGTPLAGSVQPNLISSSVVNLATGARAPQRGW